MNPLTLSKFNHKFTEAVILSQMFTAIIQSNTKTDYFSTIIFSTIIMSFKRRITHAFSPFLPKVFSAISLYKIKSRKQNQHYHEFAFEVGQPAAEFLGMSSSFVLKSRSALPNLAQT